MAISLNNLISSRHGLVFPWGHQPKDYHPGKELYVVPLLASMPLPDFIELLDELRLPKVRRNNYVIGVWILVRGKLAPPPAVPTAPLVPNVPQPSTQIPAPSLPAALQAYPQLASSALAAEVAALTPEQIQAIIRALSSGNGGIPGISGGLANAVANVAQAPHPPSLPVPHPHPHPSVPSAIPTPPIPHGQPHWTSGVPGFPATGSLPGPGPAAIPGPGPGAAFPPGPPPHPSAGPSTFMSPHARTPPQPGMSPHGAAGIHQPPSGPRGGAFSQGRYDRDDPDGRYRDERGERAGGWQQQPNGRGRGRGRSRGRSSSGGASDFVGRPVDAGWTRHRGGAPSGPAQEERGRWDGPSPPRRWG